LVRNRAESSFRRKPLSTLAIRIKSAVVACPSPLLPTTRPARSGVRTRLASKRGDARWSGSLLRHMNEDHFLEIGKRQVWGGSVPFGLSREDRLRHLYLIGKSGTGKTSLLRSLILQTIEAGDGLALVDPHGDLATDLLDHIPPNRANDVCYLDPSDPEYSAAFNLFQPCDPRRRHLVTSAIIGALKSVWRESFGPRMEFILANCIAALLESENTTLLGVQRMLSDARYRESIVSRVSDPAVRAFWTKEVAAYDRRFFTEAVSPIQNKIGRLVIGPLANLIGQVQNRMQARRLMDTHGIWIANLSKGLIGDDQANLLGSVIVSMIQAAALSRADQSEGQRVDFHLFVDEAHNFTTDSFCSFLAETRKYHVGLVLASQNLDQFDPSVRSAILANASSIIAFRVGESDAAVLAREFGGGFDPSLFANLNNFEICAKVLSDGRHGGAFLANTTPPGGRHYGNAAKIIRHSREWHSTPRPIVEDRIRRWMKGNV
jgi:type IV secretory pathway TraG/TraD family ATPase VirD4